MKLFTNKWILIASVAILVILGGLIFREVRSTNSHLDYVVLDIDDAPAQIYAQYEEQKGEPGYSINSYDSSHYILITMGAANTGGYEVQVDEVSKSNNTWLIKSTILPPGPDSLVIQAITYPAIVVKLPRTTAKIEVLVDGKPSPLIQKS